MNKILLIFLILVLTLIIVFSRNNLGIDMYYAYQAQKTNSTAFCEKMTDPHLKNGCFEDLAIKLKDYTICSKVQQTMTDIRIIPDCFIGVANATKDNAICDELKRQLFENANKAFTQEVCSHHDSLESCMKAFSSPDLRTCYSLTSG